MPLFAGEARRYKRAHDLQREFHSGNTRTQAKHIAVVVFTTLMRGIGITTQRGANSD